MQTTTDQMQRHNRFALSFIAAASLIMLSACASPDRTTEKRVVGGAAVGAAVGAVRGLFTGNPIQGAIAGGAAGAVGGAVLDQVEKAYE